MALTGVIINGACIIIGSIIGLAFKTFPEKMKETVLKMIGIFVSVIGLQMALETNQMIIVLVSLVIGTAIGEITDLEKKFKRFGDWIENKFKNKSNSNVSEAFVTASLVFVIGAMAVIGALDSGIRHDHRVLITKSIIDGISAVVFASTLGYGVILSAIPVVIYEGVITLFATQIDYYVPSVLMDQLTSIVTATGGIMIIAIGLNVLGLTKIRVTNLLPGLVVCVIITSTMYFIS